MNTKKCCCTMVANVCAHAGPMAIAVAAIGLTVAMVVGPVPWLPGKSVSSSPSSTKVHLPVGFVLSPRGNPVPHTHVYLAHRNTWAQFGGILEPPGPPPKFPTAVLRSLGVHSFADIQKTMTDRDGNFSFPPQKQNYLLIVLCPQGFAELASVDIGAGPVQIALQPWCRVDVSIKLPIPPNVTYSPGANLFQNRAFPFVDFGLAFVATKPGHFTCLNVPAGGLQVFVGKMRNGKAARNYFWRNIVLFLKAGQHAKIDFGGTGRPITGKIALPRNLENGSKASRCVKARFVLPTIPYPRHWFYRNHTKKTNWLVQWFRTPAGHAYQTAALSSFSAKIHGNGSFRMAPIPPGDYHLQYLSTGLGQGQDADWPAPIAENGLLDISFTVPCPPRGFSSAAVDLGRLKPTLITNLKPGDVAPLFTLRAADGSIVKSSELKGKVVLLYFWDWSAVAWHDVVNPQLPTLHLTEISALQRAYKKFGKVRNFAMISIATDNNRQLVRQYWGAAKIPWLQAAPLFSNRHLILDDYSYTSYKSFSSASSVIYLIGANGKISARNPRGQQIITVITKALAMARPKP